MEFVSILFIFLICFFVFILYLDRFLGSVRIKFSNLFLLICFVLKFWV